MTGQVMVISEKRSAWESAALGSVVPPLELGRGLLAPCCYLSVEGVCACAL